MSYHTAAYLFCPHCGKPLQKTILHEHLRSTCPDCAYVNWGDFSLGVGGVLWHNGKVLLVQRRHNPGQGMWTIPGGYVDHEESIGQAIVREIHEETGIITLPLSIIALRDRPDQRHDAYFVFRMQYLGGTLQAQLEEVIDLGFFTFEECHSLPIASISLSAIVASRSISKGLVLYSDVKLLGTLSTLYQIL